MRFTVQQTPVASDPLLRPRAASNVCNDDDDRIKNVNCQPSNSHAISLPLPVAAAAATAASARGRYRSADKLDAVSDEERDGLLSSLSSPVRTDADADERISHELREHRSTNSDDATSTVRVLPPDVDEYESAEQTSLLQTKSSYIPENTLNDPCVVRPLADRGRRFAARQVRRLVFKDGSCNISSRNVTERKRKYLVDIFTTLVDMKWRYNLIMFTAAFVISWLLFGVVWFVIVFIHKDHEHQDDDDWKPCVSNVYDFPTALLFSIETQTTIGYGYRVVQPECPISFFVLIIQSCVGVFVQSLMTGLIFSKLARPKQRAHTIMFSRNAIVCQRDHEYCLLFRVGDMRKSHIIGTSIRALVVKDRLTKEGETIPLCQCPLDLQTETCNSDNFLFLVWPVTVVHKIDSSSPLWDISAEQMLTERFEIIVILEGIVESTGMTTQLRSSYLPSEILWGHRLAPLLTYQKENGQYKIDYTQFHAVEPITMPDCSAKTLAELRRLNADRPDLQTSVDGYGDDADSAFLPVHFALPPDRKLVAGDAGSRRGSVLKRMRGSISLRRRRARRKSADHVGDNGLGEKREVNSKDRRASEIASRAMFLRNIDNNHGDYKQGINLRCISAVKA